MSTKRALAAESRTRVQNVTGDQTVKATPGVLHRIAVSNADVAVQTLTLKDGATTLVVLRIPAASTISAAFEIYLATSIVVNPSHAGVDALVMYS